MIELMMSCSIHNAVCDKIFENFEVVFGKMSFSSFAALNTVFV